VTKRFFPAGTVLFFAPIMLAQQPIGRTSATEVQVSGAVDISHGEMLLGNGSQITAGEQAVRIALQRGGSLRLCSTSSVHLAKDRSIDDPASSALMMALDRGAIEANYVVGKYSDVLITPDLRILISGPGQANLSIRVNPKGDTCVDNHGTDAPYVTVTSQLEGGAYRVMPDQRVNFQHGSLSEVVDHESRSAGKADRWAYLNACRYRLSHSSERGLGAAPHTARACGPCGPDACGGDGSPRLQRRESCNSGPGRCSSPCYAAPARHPSSSANTSTGDSLRASPAHSVIEQSRRLPSHRPLLLQNLRQVGKALQSTVESSASANPLKDEGVFLLWRFLPHRCARA
jgi:hypothetical protein